MTRIIKTGITNNENVDHDVIEVENQDAGFSKFYLITNKGIKDITKRLEHLFITELN